MQDVAHSAEAIEPPSPLRTQRGAPWTHRAAEHAIRACASVTIAAVVLVLAFVLREALPLFFDRPRHAEVPLGSLVLPRQWTGYDHATFVWQPVGGVAKFNIVPLLLGSLKIATLAVLIGAPVGVAAAIGLWQLELRRARRWIKPAIELLASVPSVVVGAWALGTLAGVMQSSLGLLWRLNALTASVALAVMIAPLVFTISDDAINAVPEELTEAAFALGARRFEVALKVVVPAALPGIAAALVLGLGRAIGETMIVVMVSGNAPVLRPCDPTSSARTVTATIATELGEVVQRSPHWSVLFMLGAVLFACTLALNAIAAAIIARLTRRLRGRS